MKNQTLFDLLDSHEFEQAFRDQTKTIKKKEEQKGDPATSESQSPLQKPVKSSDEQIIEVETKEEEKANEVHVSPKKIKDESLSD